MFINFLSVVLGLAALIFSVKNISKKNPGRAFINLFWIIVPLGAFFVLGTWYFSAEWNPWWNLIVYPASAMIYVVLVALVRICFGADPNHPLT